MQSKTVGLLLIPSLLILALIYLFQTQPNPAALRVDNIAEVQTLDPATANGQQESRLLSFIFEGLTVPHPRTLEPLPGVASSWEILDHDRVYRFRLNSNARWSNGDAVVGSDFIYAWKRLLAPETGSPFAYFLKDCESFESPVPSLLEIRFAKSTPDFLQKSYLWPLSPLHEKSIESIRQKYPTRWQTEWSKPENLVSNGPYRIVDRWIQDRIRFEKNPYYWDTAQVAIPSIEALCIESATTRLNLFETGELDWTQQPPIPTVAKLLGRDSRRASAASASIRRSFRNEPYLAVYLYYLNVNHPALRDRRVRRALAASVDRERITKYVTRGGQEPARSLIPPLIPNYMPARMKDWNPEFAQRELQEAGFSREKPFPVLEILYNTSDLNRDIAEVIQAEWKQNLGIDVKLLNQEWKSFLDAQVTHQYAISRGSWIADYSSPLTFLEIFSTGNGNNRSGFANAEFDALLQKAAEETDLAKRYKLYQQAEQILLDEAPVIPLYYFVTTHLVRPRLTGWETNALDMHFPKFWKIDPSQEENGWADF